MHSEQLHLHSANRLKAARTHRETGMDSTQSERASMGPSAPQRNVADAIDPALSRQQPQASSAKSRSSGSSSSVHTSTCAPASTSSKSNYSKSTATSAAATTTATTAVPSTGKRAHVPTVGGAARIYAPPPLRKNRSWNSPTFERVLAGNRASDARSKRTESPGGQQELPPFQFPPRQSAEKGHASVGSQALNEHLQSVSLQDADERGRSPLVGSRACSTGHSSMQRVGLSLSSSPYARFGAGNRTVSPAYTPLRAGTPIRSRTPLSRQHLRDAGAAHQHFSPLRGRPRSISSNTPYSSSGGSQTPSSFSAFGVNSPLSSHMGSPVAPRRVPHQAETSTMGSNSSNNSNSNSSSSNSAGRAQQLPSFEQSHKQSQRHFHPPQQQTLQAALSPLWAPDTQQNGSSNNGTGPSGHSPLRPPTTGTATASERAFQPPPPSATEGASPLNHNSNNSSCGDVDDGSNTSAYSALKGSEQRQQQQQHSTFQPPPSPSNHHHQAKLTPLRSPLTSRKSASQLSPLNPYVLAANASPRGLRNSDLPAGRRSSADSIFHFSQHDQKQAQLEEVNQQQQQQQQQQKQQQQQQQQQRQQRPRKHSLPSDRIFFPPASASAADHRSSHADVRIVRRQSFHMGEAGPKTINIQNSAGVQWHHVAMLAHTGNRSDHHARQRRGRPRSVSMPHGGPKRRTSLPVDLHVLDADVRLNNGQLASSPLEVDGTMRRKRPSISGDSDSTHCLQATTPATSEPHSTAASRRNSISTDTPQPPPPPPPVPTVVEEEQQGEQQEKGREAAPASRLPSRGHLGSNLGDAENEGDEDEERPISAGYSSSGMSLCDSEEPQHRGRRMSRPLALDTIPESLFAGLPAGNHDVDAMAWTARTSLASSDDDDGGDGRDLRSVMRGLNGLSSTSVFESEDTGTDWDREGDDDDDDDDDVGEGRATHQDILMKQDGSVEQQPQQQQLLRRRKDALKRAASAAANTTTSSGGSGGSGVGAILADGLSHSFNGGEGGQLEGKVSPLFPSRRATPHAMDLVNLPVCELNQSIEATQAACQAATSTAGGQRERNGSASILATTANGGGGSGDDVGEFLQQFGGDMLLTDPLDPLSTHSSDWDMADFDAYLNAADGSGFALPNE